VDFEAHELLHAVEEFATGFDDMPPLILGRADYRVLIATGRLASPTPSSVNRPATAPWN
jgi:hypothetical protein